MRRLLLIHRPSLCPLLHETWLKSASVSSRSITNEQRRKLRPLRRCPARSCSRHKESGASFSSCAVSHVQCRTSLRLGCPGDKRVWNLHPSRYTPGFRSLLLLAFYRRKLLRRIRQNCGGVKVDPVGYLWELLDATVGLFGRDRGEK